MSNEKWSFWRRDQERAAGEDSLERSGSESSPAARRREVRRRRILRPCRRRQPSRKRPSMPA